MEGAMNLLILTLLLAQVNTIPDGSLLFVEGGSEIVMSQTESPYSHVAIIFNEDGKPMVYEAVRPVVRKISLEEYIKQIEKDNIRKHREMKLWLRKPKNLSKKDAATMKDYCTKQLGRKYRIKSYLSEQPENTIHCGELTTRIMIAGKMDAGVNPCIQVPKTIMEFSSKWYEDKIQIDTK